jgi:hypothetical protein
MARFSEPRQDFLKICAEHSKNINRQRPRDHEVIATEAFGFFKSGRASRFEIQIRPTQAAFVKAFLFQVEHYPLGISV